MVRSLVVGYWLNILQYICNFDFLKDLFLTHHYAFRNWL